MLDAYKWQLKSFVCSYLVIRDDKPASLPFFFFYISILNCGFKRGLI